MGIRFRNLEGGGGRRGLRRRIVFDGTLNNLLKNICFNSIRSLLNDYGRIRNGWKSPTFILIGVVPITLPSNFNSMPETGAPVSSCASTI